MGGRRQSKLIPDLLAQIQRQPNETDDEWARRYNRERRRAYRSLKPKGPKRLRGPDKQLRKNAAPPEVRAALECLPGETEQERDRRYRRLVMREWRKKNREKELVRRRELERSPKYKATKEAWREKNPDKDTEYQRRYYWANREKRIASLEAWRAKNPERVKQIRREWFAKRPGYIAAYLTKYRERAVQATPPWMWAMFGKEVEAKYRECARISAKTGIPHQVDHTYPLAGKTSCGLHVPWNLQILPATVNGRKHNKSPEEFESHRVASPAGHS